MNTDLEQNTLQKLNSNNVIELIYTIRDKRIMLDRDLAKFYQVKPFRLREQVKRNINRFPDDFMFHLTDIEADSMVSQNAIPSRQSLGGSLPYAFTEQGVAAISSVITSERAVEVSIMIMRTFVALRKQNLINESIYQRVDQLEINQIDNKKQIRYLFNALNKSKDHPQQGVFFKGQIYDAYAFAADLIRSAKRSLTLVDNFIDDTVLTLFLKRKESVSLQIISQKSSKELILDLKKHQAQYTGVKLIHNRDFHDRFLIIDVDQVYHIGASLKDLCKKCFAFT
ncbi:MAG: ORF6N domain-containing protein, partial [Candidatus Cloacimonadota bacterium]|nr:ORF6N domain-containing protein [Candidatus Cloacimonadota bacterium]